MATDLVSVALPPNPSPRDTESNRAAPLKHKHGCTNFKAE